MIENKENFKTHIVSFPRTGSHWLRMMIEVAFCNSTSIDNFSFDNAPNHITYHVHDLELKDKFDKVIYLYRNPVDTIYSLIKYYQQDIEDKENIKKLTNLYKDNAQKWLLEENFTKEKMFVTYESLVKNKEQELEKIARFLGVEFNKKNIEKTKDISRDSVRNKTLYDNQIVNIEKDYKQKKEEFEKENKDYILNLFFENKNLINFFN